MKEEVKPTGDGARSERQEPGHTPTPWYEGDTAGNKLAIFSQSSPMAVAEIVGFPHNKEREAKANARFIVRAVNNHNALVEAARFARSVLSVYPMEMSERMAIEKLDAALAALETQ